MKFRLWQEMFEKKGVKLDRNFVFYDEVNVFGSNI